MSIVLSGNDQIIYSSHEASRFGLIRDLRITSQELMALVRVVRRTGKAREGHLELPSIGLGGASSNLRVRVSPLDETGRTLVLIDDVSDAQRVLRLIRADLLTARFEQQAASIAIQVLSTETAP